MTSKRYLGNIITDTPSTPANNYQDTPASGVWGMYEVADLVKAGLWPTLGSIDPSKFVENIFSTYLYEGNSSTQTITNGIDLSGEGGLVWIKSRSDTQSHELADTVRGNTKFLRTNSSTAERTSTSGDITAFNSSGFSLGVSTTAGVNNSGNDYASWTFRKAPKFFDVVTYTGTGSAGLTVSHNLGSVPGCIVVKRTDGTTNWAVYHRGADATSPENKYLLLNSTNSVGDSTTYWNDTAPTSTEFTVGTNSNVNASGGTYVAYLWAHNDGDGGFGAAGDQDIIKCGSYTGTGSSGHEITLGFEAQWLLIKRTSSSDDWVLIDNMRGMFSDTTGTGVPHLHPNTTASDSAVYQVAPTATGFVLNTGGADVNSSSTYIYMAIRRGLMAVPTSGTDVFAMDTVSNTNPAFNSGFPVDLALWTRPATTEDNFIVDRMRGTEYLITNSMAGEVASSAMSLDWSDGFHNATSATGRQAWMWRRAPKYFDVVAYTGTGSALTINHNLGVEPDMIWMKDRSGANAWIVQGKVISPSNNSRLELNDTMTLTSVTTGVTSLSSTTFSLGNWNNVNNSGNLYIAYLFASLAGVSKVGSVSHTFGSNTVVDCGFSAGARFVLLKGSDLATGWFLFDTERGIAAGNDKMLRLDNSDAQASVDYVDPNSSGFEIAGTALSTGTYIFYAIA